MDYLSWSRHFRNFPGQGDLPVLDFMEALPATGYDGALSLEIFNDQFRAGSARSVAVDGHRSLRFMLDQLRARTGTPSGLPRCRRGRVPGRRVHRVLRRRPRRAAARRAAGRAGLPPRRPAPLQGGDALAPGRHQPRGQPREGGLRPFLQHRARLGGLRAGAARRRCGGRPSSARPLLLDAPFRQAVGAGRARHPGGARRRRQPALLPRSKTSELGRVWDIEFDADRRAGANEAGLTTRRPHLAVDAVRGDAELAAVLHLAARPRKVARPGRCRSRRAGAAAR